MMRTNLLKHSLLLILSTAFSLSVNAQTFPPARNYEVHPLVLNGVGCRVSDIDAGMAVGWCGDSPRHAFAWTEATGIMDLGTLGGTTALAMGTRSGRAVGSSTLSGDLTENAMAWTLSGGMIDLGSLGGPSTLAYATAGNVVVGGGMIDGWTHAFRWTPSTGLVALPELPGSTVSLASDVDGTLIAGYAYSNSTFQGYRPLVWRTDGTLIDPIGAPLEPCGFHVCGDGISTAVRDGLVVGYSSDAAELHHAFAWSEAGGLVNLGVVAGSTESFALDTDDGAVVGQLSGPTSTRAFVWTPASGMRAITPDTVTAVATSITNGRVVGWYAAPNVGVKPFLWTSRRGAVDVNPRGFDNGSRPVGIDAAGRIALVYEDENPANTKSVVLVPPGP